MGIDMKEYKNLTGILLGPIRQRPGMYLGEPKISLLPNFILGYSIGYHMAKNNDDAMDNYFGETGFLDWFFKKYTIEPTSLWRTPFLEEANQDEGKALELFFKYLDEFNNEKNR
jgi:DNA gyrase/topoisomerase IV subunit B